MGFLDAIASMLTANTGNNTQAPLVQAALGLMNQHGGLPGLVGHLQNNGLGAEVASWIGNGDNHAVSGAQIASALGAGSIGAIATKLGVPSGEVSSGLATILPTLINHMTPAGAVPSNHGDLLSQALASFLK